MGGAGHRNLGRRALASSLIGMLLAASLVPTAAAAGVNGSAGTGSLEPPTPPEPSPGLDTADRQSVAEAEAAGDETVTLLVLAEEGDASAAASDLEEIGADVEVVEESFDYLRVRIDPERAESAARLPVIRAVDVDALIELPDPRPDAVVDPAPQLPPDASTPRDNPYLPVRDIGAAAFTADHPDLDGRGTIVAILDSGVDVDHPALQVTTDGRPKVVDWFNANPIVSEDGSWVELTGSYTVDDPPASSILPASGGPFAFGALVEDWMDLGDGEFGGDLDRDGLIGESIGVVQDRSTGVVYVDTDQDRDFHEESGVTDYGVDHDRGFLGVDDGSTPVAERVAFTVGTHESIIDPASTDPTWVNIGLAGAHGTHVAGVAAGHGLLGSTTMSGVAPGAQIMSIKACYTTANCLRSAQIDGAIYAAAHGADVLNISMGSVGALNDGNDVISTLFNDLIADHDMQIVLSAGNSGPGANTVNIAAAASDAIAVGSSVTAETWASNYGVTAEAPIGLHPFSSRGPSETGGFKPDVVAPGAAVSTTPLWQEGSEVAGTYDLPPGYSMFNGTSMAAPGVAGGAALLVGAYKQAYGGVRPDAAALRDAIRTSATFLPDLGAHEQGAGLVDVPAAWTLLQAGFAPHAVTASVPVNTGLGSFLDVPDVGVGIHEREGLEAGDAPVVREYTIHRTSGPAEPVTMQVEWTGDDGTFASPSTIAVPLNAPATLPVTIDPASAGAHSAIMRVDDPTTDGVELTTMNAAFVATPFVDGVAVLSGSVSRSGYRTIFVDVPVGTPALHVDLEGGGEAAGEGQVRFLRYHPHGVPLEGANTLECYVPATGAGCPFGDPRSRSVTNPATGVWEVVVEASRYSDVTQAPFTLTVSLLQVEFSPDPALALEPVGGSTEVTVRATNVGGPFTGLVGNGRLASTREQRPTVAAAEQQQYPVTIPAGVSEFWATTGNVEDAEADVDVYIFDCTSGTCVLAAQSSTSSSDERVRVAHPHPGDYVILLHAYSVPSGSTAIDLVDSWESTALGTIDVSDVSAERQTGDSWHATAAIEVDGEPGTGRKLTGTVEAVTSEGLVVGRGAIEFVAEPVETDTVLATSPEPSAAGQEVTLSATVSSPISTPVGEVEFFDDATSLGTAELVDGVATLSTSSLPVGPHSLRAAYAGDVAFLPSASTSVDHAVSEAATQTSLSSAPNPSLRGQDVTLTAEVTTAGPEPTGTVEFFDGPTPLGTAPLVDGTAVLMTAALSTGDHTLTAEYSGSELSLASRSEPVDHQVRRPRTGGGGHPEPEPKPEPEPEPVVGRCAEAPSEPYTDVGSDNVHAEAIGCAAHTELTVGGPAGLPHDQFGPAQPVTRAQAASFVARFLGLVGVRLPDAPVDAFGDDDGSVHEHAIDQLAAIDITTGTEPGTFDPDESVTRAQVASMLARAMNVALEGTLSDGVDAFGDDDGIVHEPAINALAAAGVVAGTGPDTFSPSLPIRRDQLVSLLVRALHWVDLAPGSDAATR